MLFRKEHFRAKSLHHRLDMNNETKTELVLGNNGFHISLGSRHSVQKHDSFHGEGMTQITGQQDQGFFLI